MPGAIESNDERFVTVESLDQRQGLLTSDRSCRGERVSEAKVWTTDAR